MHNIHKSKIHILTLIALFALGFSAQSVFAQTSQTDQSSLHIPLIGITAVPDPLALPKGPGGVTYRYAVKNFLQDLPLADIRVIDDKCGPVTFVEGDDNGNRKLDYQETWRYACTTNVSQTTQSIATATGMTNGITATHKAYTTVVVGSDILPPLVSIVNITKVAYPLALPKEGGDITFTYKVNNPGVVPLSNVSVSDDKCSQMPGKLGDTNANTYLDTDEIWIYTCTMHLKETTTNTATVTAFSNGFKATGFTTITIKVETPSLPETGEVPGFPGQAIPSFPETGVHPNFKIIVWATLSGALAGLIVFFVLSRKKAK